MNFAFICYLAFAMFHILMGHRQHLICRYPPAVRGTCNTVRNFWTYYMDTNECRLFPYNGCLGNLNRFPSLELCEDICKVHRHRKHKKKHHKTTTTEKESEEEAEQPSTIAIQQSESLSTIESTSKSQEMQTE